MSLKNWSTTANSNTSAPPNGAPEAATLLADVNDIMRQIMADVRTLAAADTIASATTCDLGTKDSTFLTVSGVTTVTGLGTVSAGIYKYVTFSGALTLTHNATSLILFGANITTVAGDSALFLSLGSGNWRCLAYQPVGGYAQLAGSTSQAFACSTLAASGAVTATGLVTANAGLKFPATQVAVADVNTLDDYQEENFTPVLNFGGATTGITYTTQSAVCTKNGREFTAIINITLSSKGSATGAATITGIPYTANFATPASCRFYAVTYTGIPNGYVNAASSTVTLEYGTEAGGNFSLDNTHFANTSALIITVTGIVAT